MALPMPVASAAAAKVDTVSMAYCS